MSDGQSLPGPEIPEALISRLGRGLGSLKMLPSVAQEALEVANSSECDLVKLAVIIQKDLRLTTFILRLANSTLFAPPKPIASLHQAVLFIGRRKARDFIITSCLEGVAAKVPHELQERQSLLWLHGFLTAILAVRLNDLLQLKFQGEEFTAGLMHDFGRTLMSVLDPVNTSSIDPLDFDEPSQIEGRERSMLGASHAEIGAWFAAHNELPPALIAAIQFHHQPENAGPNLKLAALIATADHAVNYLQREGVGKGYNPLMNPAALVLENHGVPSATKTFGTAIEKLLHEIPGLAQSMIQG
jgi:HD-like signal output (HDOD) protein